MQKLILYWKQLFTSNIINMTRSLRIEYPGASYHIMSRGNRGGNIFNDYFDYRYSMSKIARELGIHYTTVSRSIKN